MRTNKFKNDIDEIRKQEGKSKRNYLKYKTNKYLHDFQQFETIRSFRDSIYSGDNNIYKTEMDQSSLNSKKNGRI